MATLEIPVRTNTANYRFNIDLERVNYIFEFTLNERWNMWMLKIFDNEENLLLSGIPMQVAVGLTTRFSIPNFFPGFLFILDTEGTTEDMENIGDFGTRFKLTYTESE